jgi:hypothetical protein
MLELGFQNKESEWLDKNKSRAEGVAGGRMPDYKAVSSNPSIAKNKTNKRKAAIVNEMTIHCHIWES